MFFSSLIITVNSICVWLIRITPRLMFFGSWFPQGASLWNSLCGMERPTVELMIPSSISTAAQRVEHFFFKSLCFSHARSERLHVNQVQDCSTTPASSLLLRMVHSHWKQFPEFTSGQQGNRGCVSGRRFSDEKVTKAKGWRFQELLAAACAASSIRESCRLRVLRLERLKERETAQETKSFNVKGLLYLHSCVNGRRSRWGIREAAKPIRAIRRCEGESCA